jgi:hypothetical protein
MTEEGHPLTTPTHHGVAAKLKVAVQWFNQALCFYQSFCLVDSEVLRNRHLLVAANRYRAFKKQLHYYYQR